MHSWSTRKSGYCQIVESGNARAKCHQLQYFPTSTPPDLRQKKVLTVESRPHSHNDAFRLPTFHGFCATLPGVLLRERSNSFYQTQHPGCNATSKHLSLERRKAFGRLGHDPVTLLNV